MNDSAYQQIAANLDKHAAGVPKSKGRISPAFMDYLKLLYTPDEAELVQHLRIPREILPDSFDPAMFRTAGHVARMSGRDVFEVRKTLDSLVFRNHLLGSNILANVSMSKKVKRALIAAKTFRNSLGLWGSMKRTGKIAEKIVQEVLENGLFRPGSFLVSMYALPYFPVLLNVHQTYEQTKPEDLQAARMYQDFFVRDGYYKYYEGSKKGTPHVRVINVERTIDCSERLLDNQDAHRIIDASPSIGLVPCPCRTRMEKMGTRECRDNNPVGFCIVIGFAAIHREMLGRGYAVTHQEAKKYLDDMQNKGLVVVSDNWQKSLSIICLCCSCCCSMLRGRTRWDNPKAVSPSVFIPRAGEQCVQCGKCGKQCFFGALSVNRKQRRHTVDPEKCIGCGVCTIACPNDALKLHAADRRVEVFRDAKALYERIEVENKILGKT